MRLLLFVLVLLATLNLVPVSGAVAGTREAVYVHLADSLRGSFDGITADLRSAFGSNGWQVLAVHEAAAERCAYRARVFVLHNADHARTVLARGPRAAFALPARVLLFEDEHGIHLATLNPRSIYRTIIAESGFEQPSDALLRDITRIATGALTGRFASHAYGQVRDRGLIGRTMGVMAGGPFTEKIEEVHAVAGSSAGDIAAVAAKIWKAVEPGTRRGRWQLGGIYQLDLSTQGVYVIGVSGPALETKSFAIVGAGNDDRRAGLQCPGIAHALAYPIEIVIFAEGGKVRVCTVDGMYRMKMYFEDAGKMKFAANMGMPGAIEDELRGLILSGLGASSVKR